ncbi:hypothetical protein L6164_032756 [Bauhinia variegata]|uniref:Uncharacterized protein n=1 Tax=Bauhinia variegata TaxID=167791 RepID=A0ACB9KPW6_BAUVA|nr:hypothetical protein L6164_032756 [Bauhinia variegata]
MTRAEMKGQIQSTKTAFSLFVFQHFLSSLPTCGIVPIARNLSKKKNDSFQFLQASFRSSPSQILGCPRSKQASELADKRASGIRLNEAFYLWKRLQSHLRKLNMPCSCVSKLQSLFITIFFQYRNHLLFK